MGRKEDGRQLADPLSKMGNRAQWEIFIFSGYLGVSPFAQPDPTNGMGTSQDG